MPRPNRPNRTNLSDSFLRLSPNFCPYRLLRDLRLFISLILPCCFLYALLITLLTSTLPTFRLPEVEPCPESDLHGCRPGPLNFIRRPRSQPGASYTFSFSGNEVLTEPAALLRGSFRSFHTSTWHVPPSTLRPVPGAWCLVPRPC